MWFEGKWMQLEDIMLHAVIQDQTHKASCFLPYVEDRSKDEHIYKNKHGHTQTQMQNMFVTVELLYGTRGEMERKRE
jgi:hypothetical protein